PETSGPSPSRCLGPPFRTPRAWPGAASAFRGTCLPAGRPPHPPCIPPHPLGDLLGLRPRERLAINPPRLQPFAADAGQLAAATDQRRRLGCRVSRENRIKSWKPRIMWKVWNGG